MLNHRDTSYSWKFPVADVGLSIYLTWIHLPFKYELSGLTVHTVCLLIPREARISLNFLVSQPNTLTYYCCTNAEEYLDLPPPLPLTTVNSCLAKARDAPRFHSNYYTGLFNTECNLCNIFLLQERKVNTELEIKPHSGRCCSLKPQTYILHMENRIRKDCIHRRQNCSYKPRLLSSKINSCITITSL